MYDTITMFIDSANVPSVDFLAEIPLKLTGVTELYDHRTDSCKLTGTFNKVFHATVSHSGLLLTGSLCKSFHGNNQRTLALGNVRESFDKLFSELSIPIEQAIIYRVDVGENYVVDNTAPSYYSYMGDARYYTRSTLDMSLYYNNSSRQMNFYDKIAEQEGKGVVICPEFTNKNVLRFEYRVRKGLAVRMGMKEVRPLDLCNPGFYKAMLENYLQEYLNIEKYNLIDFIPGVTPDSKSFFGQMALLGVQSLGGQFAVNNIITRAKKQGAFANAMAYKRVKDKLREICNMSLLTCKSPHVDELTAKITERVATEIAGL